MLESPARNPRRLTGKFLNFLLQHCPQIGGRTGPRKIFDVEDAPMVLLLYQRDMILFGMLSLVNLTVAIARLVFTNSIMILEPGILAFVS